jgi:hypothetical protein
MRVVERAQILRLGRVRDADRARLHGEVGLAQSPALYKDLVCARWSAEGARWMRRDCTYSRVSWPARPEGSSPPAGLVLRPFSGYRARITTGYDVRDNARSARVVGGRRR